MVTWPRSSSPVERGADLAVAEGGDDRPFGRVGLASVLDQLDGLGSAGECGEDATGLDRWELLRVADQDHLGVGSDGGVDHGGEHPGAEHAGLVDDEDVARLEPGAAGLELVVECVGGGRSDAGAGFEFACRSGGEADASDSVAGGFERVSDRVEGEGLAGTGSADDDVDRSTGAAEVVEHGALFVGERRSCLVRCSDGGDVGSEVVGGGSVGVGEDRLFERLHLGGGPAAGAEVDGLLAGEVLVGAFEDRVEGGALAGGLGHGPDDVASFVGGVFVGEGEGEFVVVDLEGRGAGDPGHGVEVEAVVGGALAPLGSELGFGDAGLLGLAGLEVGDPGGVAGVGAHAIHLGDDLGAASGEGGAHVGADAGDLGDAVAVHLVEHEPESGGELVAEGGLEDGLAGVALVVELGWRGARCVVRRGLRRR